MRRLIKNIFYYFIPFIILYASIIPIVIYLGTFNPFMPIIIGIMGIILICILLTQLLSLKLNLLWWPFSLFVIPFKYNKKSIMPYISLILNISFFIILSFSIPKYDFKKEDKFYKYVSKGDVLELTLPKTYDDCGYNDLYNVACYDEKNNIAIMINNYEKGTYENPTIDSINNYVSIIKSKDETFEKVKDGTSYLVNNKNVYSEMYISKKSDVSYYFIISSVSYLDSDTTSLVVQVVTKTNYNSNKANLEDIIESITKIKKEDK